MHQSIASVLITIYLDSLYLIQFESETEVFQQLCGKLIKTSVRKDHKFCHVKHYILLSVILWYLIFNPGKTATKSTQKTFFGPRRRGGRGCVSVWRRAVWRSVIPISVSPTVKSGSHSVGREMQSSTVSSAVTVKRAPCSVDSGRFQPCHPNDDLTLKLNTVKILYYSCVSV